MKIIKEGIADRDNCIRIICKCCDAGLELSSDDFVKYNRRRYSIICPCCEQQTILYECQIPYTLLSKIENRETN